MLFRQKNNMFSTKNIRNFFLHILPKNKLGDHIYCLLTFVWFHKRLPNNSDNFLDILYRLKVSSSIDDTLRCFVSDKHYMKLFVTDVLGKEYCIPTLDLLSTASEIMEFKAKVDCVVKPCHSSGFVKYCDAGTSLDLHKYEKWLTHNYYYESRERNYRYLPQRLVVEPILFDDRNIKDYKFFFFNGEFIFTQVDVDRSTSHKRSFYDADFNFLGFSTKYPLSDIQSKPFNYTEMILVAKQLSKHFKGLIRIDLYTNGSEIKVGEITNCHGSGFENIIPLGKQIIISDFIK